MSAPDALETIAAVRAACKLVDGHDPLDEAAALALKHHGTEGASVAVAVGGFALARDGELTLAVAPESRRHGVGGRLLAQVGVADRAWSHGGHPGAAALAAAHGWDRTRDLWVMRRPTSLELPSLVVPDGETVRGYADGDAEQVLAVNGAAFAHHPEQGGLDATGLAERMAEPWWDPAGLLVAVDDATGDVLAFHWTKQHDASLGEVYVVAVGPAAQGRGLGRVVTLAGLHHLAGLGVAEVLLYVESDNKPAVRLYSSLGFEHAARDTHVQYTRRLGT
ncbi:mycothiol synthase [Nocardioides sp.]|uniref:mycothiol synthase n=1 Tax=Nocardioides sp. TaxID=35761 RepID=UPI00271A222F|nr:mycothiol synthase [Nocardioides sp.]MDO9454975.1 mycothiol synthase [Nocardioides sp.]